MGSPLDYMFGLLANQQNGSNVPVSLPPMGGWAHAGGFTANPTPQFRVPTDQAGPSPPIGPQGGPLAAMLGTHLMPDEEASYQKWKGTLPKRLQYEGDYDLRGFYHQNPMFSVKTPGQHMTDEFKLPNHQTFSNESRYYNDETKKYGGHWEGDVYIPNDTHYKQRVDETPPARRKRP